MVGLKFNISVTLILLLGAGMLLTNIITTTLWQRSLIAEKKYQQHYMLANFLKTTANSPPATLLELEQRLRKIPDFCGGLLVNRSWRTITTPSCNPSKEFKQIADDVINTNKPAVVTNNTPLDFLFHKQRYLYTALPLPSSYPPKGVIATATPLRPVWQELRENQKIILVYILVNTIFLTVIGFFRLASIIIKPIERLVMATHTYSDHQDLGFISEHEDSEFRQLSSSINSMVQRIDKDKVNLRNTVNSLADANKTIKNNQQEMVRTEKLASVGRLSAGLAHEIGNPLGIVLGYLGLLQKDDLPREERLEYIKRSEDELNRINALVRQLLDFSRPMADSAGEPSHMHELLQDIIDMLQAQKKNRGITVEAHLTAESNTVQGSKEALRQAFVNFFLNAIDAIHEANRRDRGKITVETTTILDDNDTKLVQIIITDNGCGIPAEQMENIFDPFYTTKDPGKGTGLGLSVAFGIIEKTGGTVSARSVENEGTSLVVQLPLIDQKHVSHE